MNGALDLGIWAIHRVTFAISMNSAIELVARRAIRETPMWTPVASGDAKIDRPAEEDAESSAQSTLRLLLTSDDPDGNGGPRYRQQRVQTPRTLVDLSANFLARSWATEECSDAEETIPQ